MRAEAPDREASGPRAFERVASDVYLGVIRPAADYGLPIWFLLLAVSTVAGYISIDYIGIDVLLYRQAAIEALTGGNPWAIQANDLAFAGPPMTLLFYLPLSFVPLQVATIATMSLGVAAAVLIVRRLDLPIWWVLFPPIVESVLVGNPDVLVVALLLVRGPVAGLAAGLKVYALIPLILQRRWSAVAVAGLVVAVSLPWLFAFIDNLSVVTEVLNTQTGQLSAWGTWAILPVGVALLILRRQGAEWLIVPAMWPNTQWHYASMALPAVNRYPIAAAVIGLHHPLMPAIGVIVMAFEAWIRLRGKV